MEEQKWISASPDFHEIISSEENIICIQGNSDLEKEFYSYAQNFKKSAHILTTHLFESSPDISKLDTYFFSLAYLYRHSLELILKAVGFKYITSLFEREEFVNDTFHNLLSILDVITPYIADFIKIDKTAYNWLVSLFEDMNQIDKESDSFRYPFGITVTRDDPFSEIPKRFGIKPFFEKQTHIDLVAFACKMEVAFDILDRYYLESLKINENHKKYSPVFLEEGGSYYGQSVLGYSYSRNRFYPYVKSYTESAKCLFEYVKKNNKTKETLFFPMCYLYRNGIELALKEILFEESSHNYQSALELINKKKHKILGLWNSIKGDVEKHANAPQNDPHLQNAEKYIVQLHSFDGTSDKFRYPTNKYLELHFKKVKKLDIKNVAEFFEQLSYFLYGVCSMMSHQNELQAEMEAEFRSEIAHYSDYDYY